MNENSRLIPSRIIAQSNAAINKLQTDNELLRVARSAKDAFIGDGTNYSQGINNLKRKMEDYQKVCDAFVQANDADIIDHGKLISMVGDQDLIGSEILQQIRDSLNSRDFYNGRIDHYQSVRDNTSFAQRNLAFWDWTYSRARNSQRNYERLRDINNEIMARYVEKRERYDEIERSTKEFFTIGCELRAKAKLGIGHIREASPGLPNSFQSDALATWRTDISTKKENARERTLDRLAQKGIIVRDADGNVIDYNWEMMRELDYDTLLIIIRKLGYDYSWIVESVDIAELFLGEWREEWGLTEDINRQELLLQKFADYRMIEAIRIVNQDPRFSSERWEEPWDESWENLEPEELEARVIQYRKDMLQEYMEALVDIFGVEIVSDIRFTNTPPNERNEVNLGSYSPSNKRISVNEWIIEDWASDRSYDRLFETILHELRHAYQHEAINNPEQSVVSGATIEAWRANFPPPYGFYISSGNRRRDGKGYYDMTDYRNQPIEVDAFSFGNLEQWVKER